MLSCLKCSASNCVFKSFTRAAQHVMQRRVSFSSKQKYFWKVFYVEYYSYLGCVRLGNLDLDFKIRISDLQSNAKSENGFQR